MRYLLLGKTDLKVSEVGFGGIPIIRLATAEAAEVLRRAYHRGITLFDTANVYLDSEEKMGLALADVRSRLVLATKTLKRDRAGAEADIDLSLRRLRTDYLDLFQIHQVSQESDTGRGSRERSGTSASPRTASTWPQGWCGPDSSALSSFLSTS
jgi:aryl-alcohol dehydrogenase-like predicted oxidoreductase